MDFCGEDENLREPRIYAETASEIEVLQMKLVDKLERKLGRFAIPNLMIYIIIFYLIGFVLYYYNPYIYINYLSLNARAILHGQIWRIVTYLMYPPSTNIIWMALLSFIY